MVSKSTAAARRFARSRPGGRGTRLVIGTATLALLTIDGFVVLATPAPVSLDAVVAGFRAESGSTDAASSPFVAAASPAAAGRTPAGDDGARSLAPVGPTQTAADEAAPSAAPPPGGQPESSEAAGTAATRQPEPGVYVYVTDGGESLDAPGGRHDYPGTTTLTYQRTACGFRIRWDALRERWDEHDYCVHGDGWALHGVTSHHEFFGQSKTDRLRCTGNWMIAPDARPGATWSGSCTDGAQRSATSGRVIGFERLTVAGTPVETVHVLTESAFDGDDASHGKRTLHRWLARDTRLIVKAVASMRGDVQGPFGPMEYREDYTIQLRDLRPRR